MQIDASKIADSLPYLHLTWSGPLLLVVATFMLHHYLGAAGLAGFGVMVLSMPLNGLLARNMQRFVVRVMKARDLPLTAYYVHYVLRTTYCLLLTTSSCA